MIQSTAYGAMWSTSMSLPTLLRPMENDPAKGPQWLMPLGACGVLTGSITFGTLMDIRAEDHCAGQGCFTGGMLMLLLATTVLVALCIAIKMQGQRPQQPNLSQAHHCGGDTMHAEGMSMHFVRPE